MSNDTQMVAVCIGTYEKKYENGSHAPESALTGQPNPASVEYTESLYRRADGSYYLSGHGYGKYSKQKRCGGGGGHFGRSHGYYYETVASSKIISITEEEAQAWISEHVTTEQDK